MRFNDLQLNSTPALHGVLVRQPSCKSMVTMEGSAMSQHGASKMERRFWDIPSAANQAGYSSRHFRRIIEEQGIPVMRIGRKFFILGRDLENWQSNQGGVKASEAVKVG